MSLTPVKDRRITIIGGAGFIGHNLALHLQRLGAAVSIIDGLSVNNLTSVLGNSDNLPHPRLSQTVLEERLRLLRDAGVQLHVQDARDYHALSRIITTTAPQVIIHLAAVSHANRSNKDPFSTFDHSLRTLENALDNSRGAIEHFIYLSSSMVYGNFKDGAVDEQTPCEPLGIYGALKFSGEKIVVAYNQVFGLPYTIIRPSALYGERCISRRVGQILIENAMFGEDITVTGDGLDGLDFTYIQDLVDGLTKVIENNNSHNQIFNLTYGSARTISDMVDILRTHFPDIAIKRIAKDALMPDRGTLSIDKARSLIGYEPSWSLDQGYPKYIEWYKSLFARHPEFKTQVIVKVPLLQADSWLTTMLGCPAYHLLSPHMLTKAKLPTAMSFLDARVAVDSLHDLHHLQSLNFRLVETNLQLTRKPAPFTEHSTECRFAIPDDEPAVRSIASTSFCYSRFHLDPAIAAVAANNLKSQWAGNFFSGNRGDWMVVALENGLICGFIQLNQLDNYSICIDLIAVSADYQGRGMATAMIAFAASSCLDRPATLVTGTQVANVPSLALYNKLGFVLRTANYVLHLHTTQVAK